MAPKLGEKLGQPVYVENKPGANGIIGMSEVQRAAPDGYTIMFAHSGALTINASIVKNMPLDTLTDLTPIGKPVTVPMVWVANPDSRFRDLKDVITYARAEPGKIDYANPSNGSLPHLIFEAFKQRHKLDIVAIPFNGTPAAQQEVVAGRIPLMVDSLGAAWGHIDGKRTRVLAVTQKERAAALPDVPTTFELGLEDREYTGWYGMLAPKDLPPAITAKLVAAINATMADPDTAARIMKLGAQPQRSDPDDLRSIMTHEREMLGKIVRAAGLEPK
jgi:tripartite-type tricarboxylate transporter receptor subunit TctC